MVDKLLSKDNRPVECDFFNDLPETSKNLVKEYLTDDERDVRELPDCITDPLKNVLYVIRGGLACGVLEHCLSLRCGVNYGVPDEERKKLKRLAVPYEAADVPSKKNEYSQPDVSIILSYLAYYSQGLKEEEFEECLRKLKEMNMASQVQIYEEWRSSLGAEQREELDVKNVKEIKIESVSQRSKLFGTFHRNRKCIAFWLKKCVFPKDMIQFNNSITSSSWDHSNVKESIGFSGTKDNRRLFPTYIKYKTNENLRIKGTDGKMLNMLMEHTTDVIIIEESDTPLW